jgi:hypothetical protein
MEPLTAAVIVLAVLVLLLAAAGAGLLRRIRELELSVYRGIGLHLTGPASTQAGGAVAVPGAVTVVAKVNRRCPVCAEVLRVLGERAAAGLRGVELVVVTDDPQLAERVPAGLRVISDPAVWRAVEVPFVPALLVVDQHGIVVETTPAGSGDVVADVVRRAVASAGAEAS